MKPSYYEHKQPLNSENERLTTNSILKNNKADILENNRLSNLSVAEQLQLFSEIIVDIYLQNLHEDENQQH